MKKKVKVNAIGLCIFKRDVSTNTMKFVLRVSVHSKQNVWLTEIINVNVRGNLAMAITHDYSKSKRIFLNKVFNSPNSTATGCDQG